jgi:hypothetical protein
MLRRAIWALFAYPVVRLDLEWSRWKLRRLKRRLGLL